MPDHRDIQGLIDALHRLAYDMERANDLAAATASALESIAEQYGIALPLTTPQPPDCGDLFSTS